MSAELLTDVLVQVKRDFTNFKKTGESRRTKNYLSTRLSLLEENLAAAQRHYEAGRSVEKLEFRCELLDGLDRYSGAQSSLSDSTLATNIPHSKDIRLPKINIPEFSGCYTKWRSFHDIFVSLIHSNTSLGGIQKLHYLKSSLTGEAARLLQHLALDAGNYEKAWELLKARYDHKRVLVSSQLQLFFNQVTQTKETADGLKSLMDTSLESIYALKNLEIPVDSWDVIIIYVMVQKLPTSTQQLWEEKLGNSKDLPTLKDFTEFLETRFRTLEAVAQKGASGPIAKPCPKSQPAARTYHTVTNFNQFQCKVCNNGQHSLRKCKRFLGMDVTRRQQTVRQTKVCDNCLAYSHTTRNCPSTKNCYFCHRRHHSLLHINFSNNTETMPQLQQHNKQHKETQMNPNADSFNPTQGDHPSGSGQVRNTFHTSHTYQYNSKVLLATAVVKVLSANGRYVELRALIDPGSEASFISESATQILKLPKQNTFVQISGLGKVSSGTTNKYVDLKFASRRSTFEGFTKAFVFKSLTGLLPAHQTTMYECRHLKNLELADPLFHTPAPIDLLLGSDVYADIIMPDIVRSTEPGMPIAQRTQLGWVVLGKVSETPLKLRTFTQNVSLDKTLRKFWEIEELPFPTQASKEDIECERHFLANTTRRADGRYEVALPFKIGKHPALGSSKEGALRRFSYLERRFQRDAGLKESYTECIREYLTLDHMEEVNVERELTFTTPHHYFLPHHAVFKAASSTTKLRVVFDAAFKTSDGTSLNEHLLVGPILQRNIVDIILGWRRYQHTFTADIEKMYRQIFVKKADSYYQVIFWRDSSGQLKTFRLKTVTFGTTSAPYLAIRVLQKVAKDEMANYPIGAQTVLEEMYVDDLISGDDTVEGARTKREEVRKLLSSAGFKLRKWTSNTRALIEDIPPQDREMDYQLPFESSVHIKTLGIKWFPVKDCFSFQVTHLRIEETTKRTILSAIAKLFDPLGWISPCVIKAKLIMQQLWGRGTEWDQPVPEDIQIQWKTLRNDLLVLEQVEIPRWINSHGSCRIIELHGFSDASIKAYGAAVYIRVWNEQGHTQMHLLMSKTKVAPLKTVSLPRLELCGAVLLATLMDHTAKVFNVPRQHWYAWSDSTITLAWIRAPSSSWTTFVSNRVSEIQRLTDSQMWKHIPTQHNPADLASRGLLPSELRGNDLWWNGPAFMRDQWNFPIPEQPTNINTEEERRTIKTHVATTQTQTQHNIVGETITKFSRLHTILRVLAYCQRFISNCRSGCKKSGPLQPEELNTASQMAIRSVQKDMFPEDLTKLHDSPKATSALKSLNPFIDADGILRVGGRLQNSNLTYNQKHPIILKSNHHFTKTLLKDAHEKTQHGGIQQMTAYIRTRYWIIQIKQCVKHTIHQCVKCFKHKAKAMTQLMASLPAARVRIARPFTNTGVDYAGPIDIKTWKGKGAKTLKGYFAIFICLATKAIHLEAVSDLTTQAFLAAFRRFTARRGICSEIFSDCGTNFVGANTELKKWMKDARNEWKEIADTLSNQGTKWNFIPPASPHFGGLWEAGVKSVKHHLKRVGGDRKLTFEEFSTLLTQIEACLNSRPLCPLSDNPEDLEVITPAHFLIGETLNAIPSEDTSTNIINTIDRWKRVQVLTDSFWRKWSTEYLARLQQRPKWTKLEEEPKVGDLVLLKDERLPATQWMLARITQLHPGNDGHVRVVTLKTKTSTLKRPITKLCYLPTNKTTQEQQII